ncbi:hypothetical protein NMYAN_20388 [Nitrosomonas nitrosa]|uniref:Uncharacterized protein n=1 Tax=Nitrosomonas nitrosa TaxID=52442 RepID=A0A8H8Z0I9_9PROT|nr:hypothetical protein NMYAN_20388 [Nitrosomonas nitrosa]
MPIAIAKAIAKEKMLSKDDFKENTSLGGYPYKLLIILFS